LDTGVIKNLKLHYRSQIVRQQLVAYDELVPFEFDILGSIRLLRRAWSMVKPETIVNCYKSMRFCSQEIGKIDEMDSIIDLSSFASEGSNLNALRGCHSIPDEVNFLEYAFFDENIAVTEVLTDYDIIMNVSSLIEINETDDGPEISDDEKEKERSIVTAHEALNAFKVVTQSYDCSGCDKKFDINLSMIEKDLQNSVLNSRNQTCITDFFKK
jgi:hypothetical protein